MTTPKCRCRLSAVLLLGPLLAACVAREPVGPAYPRPDTNSALVVGRSREADIVAIYGQPTKRSETGATRPADPKLAANFHPFLNATLTYQNGDRVTFAYPARSRAARLRTITFQLHDGVLTGYSFSSPIPEDDRVLNVAAASALLARAEVTRPELVAALGPPQSRQTFQATGPNGVAESDTWAGTVRTGSDTVSGSQSLFVTFGADGRVLRHTLTDVITQQ